LIEQEVTETTESESLCFLCLLCLQGTLPCIRFSLIDKCLLVDAKAVEEVHPIHKAQLLSYMKLLDILLGLIINFHTLKLTDVASEVDPT